MLIIEIKKPFALE